MRSRLAAMIIVQPGEKVPIDGVVVDGCIQPEHQRADGREPAA